MIILWIKIIYFRFIMKISSSFASLLFVGFCFILDVILSCWKLLVSWMGFPYIIHLSILKARLPLLYCLLVLYVISSQALDNFSLNAGKVQVHLKDFFKDHLKSLTYCLKSSKRQNSVIFVCWPQQIKFFEGVLLR